MEFLIINRFFLLKYHFHNYNKRNTFWFYKNNKKFKCKSFNKIKILRLNK